MLLELHHHSSFLDYTSATFVFVNYVWDEDIREEVLSTWNTWQQSLAHISTVTVLRCVKFNVAEKLSNTIQYNTIYNIQHNFINTKITTYKNK